MKHRLLSALAMAAVATISTAAASTKNAVNKKSVTCAFINENAFNNQASCFFTNTDHRIVQITPNKPISIKQAAKWLADAAIYLHIGGERKFSHIQVATRPDWAGKTVEAKIDNSTSFPDDPKMVKEITVICDLPVNWNDVVGKDEKEKQQPACKKMP